MKNMIKKLTILPVIAAALIAGTGCSGMLDIPATLPLLKNVLFISSLASRPGVTTVSGSGAYFVSENNGILYINVVLNASPEEDVTFTTASSDLTEADLSTTDLTFTPDNWNVPQTIQVTGVDDYIPDGNIDIHLVFGSVVSGDPRYNGMPIASVPILVLDDETYSIVVSPLSLETTEAAGTSHTATFYVALSTEPLFNVSIPSIASSDFSEGIPDQGSLIFTPANWDTPQAVTVSAVDDGVEDGTQTYSIELDPSESLDVGYNGLTLGPVSVTNLDAQASIVVSPLTMNLVEGGDNVEWGDYYDDFSVVLSSAPSGDVTIGVTSENTARATVNRSLLTFTILNWDTPQLVRVTAVENGIEDISDPVMIDLGTASGGGYDGREPSDVRVYIEDNDGAGIRVSRMSRETREAGLQNATFRVRLNKQPSMGTTVTIPIHDTYDIKNYQNREGFVDKTHLTFNDANWSTEQVVTVTPAKDYEMDGDVQYIIALLPVISGDSDYHGKNPRDVTVNNFNEDVAGIIVDANGTTTTLGVSNQSFNGFATDDMGNMGYAYANWRMKLRSKPASNVTIGLVSNSTTNDGSLNVPSFTFTRDNWNEFQTVRVTGASDGTNEGNVNYTVGTTLSSSDGVYGEGSSYVGKPSFVVRSCDNDVGSLIVDCACSGANTTATSESGGQAAFYLISKSAPGTAVYVDFSVNDATEGIPPTDGTVIITGTNYNRLESAGSNRVVVTGADDVIFDGTVAYQLIPSESYGGLVYQIPWNYNLSNSDNEQRYVTSVTGQTSEDTVTTAAINVRLGAQPSADVVMSVACTDTTECRSVTPTTMTFTNGDWNVNQQVTVTGEDDTIADGNVSSNISFTVSSSDSVFNGQNFNVSVVNQDNEPPAKAVWVTSVDRNGEMSPGVSTADAYCNGSDPAKPTGLGAATYKALMVDGDARVATTTGTDSTGQTGWVLLPGYYYYLRTGATGSDATTRLFIADSYGLIQFPMDRAFSATGSYWTGMNANMTTATTYGDNCARWTLVNNENDPFEDYYGQYGAGGATDAVSICSGSDTCSTLKRVICVQQ